MIDSDGKLLVEAAGRFASAVFSKINGLSNIRMDFIGLPFRLGDCLETATTLSLGVYSGDKSGAFAFFVEEAGDIYSKFVGKKENIPTKTQKLGSLAREASYMEDKKDSQISKMISLVSQTIKTSPALLATISVETLETSKKAGEIYARSGSVPGAVLESLMVPAIILFSIYAMEHWNEHGKKQEEPVQDNASPGQSHRADKTYGLDYR